MRTTPRALTTAAALVLTALLLAPATAGADDRRHGRDDRGRHSSEHRDRDHDRGRRSYDHRDRHHDRRDHHRYDSRRRDPRHYDHRYDSRRDSHRSYRSYRYRPAPPARFTIPRHIYSHDRHRFDSYYYGRTYHRSHRHYHSIYSFPVYLDGHWSWRPYAYCEGAYFAAGIFTRSGPYFSIEIGF
jgi:hypothetical protein